MLHRVRGYALVQSGDHDGAETALEESLQIARDGEATYELAQSLEARARLRARAGSESGDDEHEARKLFE